MTQSRVLADTPVTTIGENATQVARGNNHGKNLIINGDFSINQREFTTTSSAEFTVDRLEYILSGATGSCTLNTLTQAELESIGNTSSTNYITVDITVGNDNAGLDYRVEGLRQFAGRECTLSFYAKGTNPATKGDLNVQTREVFGSGGSPTSTRTTDVGDFTLTGSWTRYSLTFTLSSHVSDTYGTDEDDYFRLLIGQGSDTSTDAWDLDIKNIQLEFGDTATDFEYVKPSEQLANCKRYFERRAGGTNTVMGSGYCINTVGSQYLFNFESKRTIPTVTTSSSTGLNVLYAPGAVANTSAVTFDLTSKESTRLNATVASVLTAGESVLVTLASGTDYIDIDAEL